MSEITVHDQLQIGWMNTLQNHIYFTKLDIRDEAESMIMWLDILGSNSDLENLSGNDLNDMQYLQSQFYFTNAGKKAAAVLNEYYHEGHFTPAFYQESTALPRSSRVNSNVQEEIALMQLYPNPAREYVQVFIHSTGIRKENLMIRILDMNGKTVSNLQLVPQQCNFIIDTQGISAGRYVISLLAGENELDSQILQIVK